MTSHLMLILISPVFLFFFLVRTNMWWQSYPVRSCWRNYKRPISCWRRSSKVSTPTWRRSVSTFHGSSSCPTRSCWKSSPRPKTPPGRFNRWKEEEGLKKMKADDPLGRCQRTGRTFFSHFIEQTLSPCCGFFWVDIEPEFVIWKWLGYSSGHAG